jgi:hypothetical protein
LRDAWIALRNIQNNTQQRFEQAFRTVAEASTAGKTLKQLVVEGALVSKIDFGRFDNGLQYAAYQGDIGLVKLVLAQAVHVDVKGELAVVLFPCINSNHCTQVVIMGPHSRLQLLEDIRPLLNPYLRMALIQILKVTLSDSLTAGKKLQSVGGDYGSALSAACANGRKEVVEVMLKNDNFEKKIGETSFVI